MRKRIKRATNSFETFGTAIAFKTHSAAQSKWINEGKTHVIFNHGDPNSKGVLILFPHNIDYNS